MAVLKTNDIMIDLDSIRGLVVQKNIDYFAVAAIFDGHAIAIKGEDAEALWEQYRRNCQSFLIDKDGKSVPVQKKGDN